MGRPKTVPDEKLLGVAQAEFSRRGHAASTRQIAMRAGISQATLFQRFGGKDKLFLAANSPSPLDTDLILGELRNTTTATSYLTDVAIRLHSQIRERAPQVLLLAREPVVKPALVVAAHAKLGVPMLISSLTNRIGELQRSKRLDPDMSPTSLVEALLVAIHGLVFMDLMSRGLSPPAAAVLKRLVSLLIQKSIPSKEEKWK